MNKKIGIFCGYYLPHLGGVERYVDKLAGALQELGYEIVIVTSNHDSFDSVEKINNHTVYRLPILNLAKTRYPIPRINSEYKHLIRQIEDEKIDCFIVNTRFHLTSLVGARMGKRSNRHIMLIEHGTNHFTVNNRILDFFGLIYEHVLSWIIKRYVDKYYGVSKKCNEWMRHFSIKASGVFYNAVDAEDTQVADDRYFVTYPVEEIVITFAGRLIKEKGILNLLEAFELVRQQQQHLNLKLVVAGDGDLLASIRRDYTNSSVNILGKLDFKEIMSLFKRTDIFVHPSLYPEGLPTSILEAGLMGCALIATPRGGTEEVIQDKRHGIIVDGSIESLREAIEQLVTNSNRRRELADTARQRIETVFNWKAVAELVDKEITGFNAE